MNPVLQDCFLSPMWHVMCSCGWHKITFLTVVGIVVQGTSVVREEMDEQPVRAVRVCVCVRVYTTEKVVWITLAMAVQYGNLYLPYKKNRRAVLEAPGHVPDSLTGRVHSTVRVQYFNKYI